MEVYTYNQQYVTSEYDVCGKTSLCNIKSCFMCSHWTICNLHWRN